MAGIGSVLSPAPPSIIPNQSTPTAVGGTVTPGVAVAPASTTTPIDSATINPTLPTSAAGGVTPTAPATPAVATPAVTATPAPAPVAATAGTIPPINPAAIDMNKVISIVKELVSAIKQLAGVGGADAPAVAAPAAGAAAVPAASAAAAAPAGTDPGTVTGNGAALNRNVVIAQLDNFTADDTGFNHGEEIAATLRAGGGDPSLAGKVDLMQFPLGNDTTGGIAGSLQQVLQAAQSGQTVDAVVIPQQVFAEDANTPQIRATIDQLAALGIPVVIAAGNEGPAQQNVLGTGNSLLVQNTEGGAVSPQSGQGNVSFEGRTTSFASANLAAVAAAKHAFGTNINGIKQQLI